MLISLIENITDGAVSTPAIVGATRPPPPVGIVEDVAVETTLGEQACYSTDSPVLRVGGGQLLLRTRPGR